MKLSNINLGNLKTASSLAEICGIHAGDGYLRDDGKRRELDISGNVEEKEYYDKHVIPLFKKVFDIELLGRFFPHRNTYGFVIRDRKIIKFMHGLGFPYGDKSTKVRIPKFILKGDSLKKRFLRGYFDTDGCLFFGKRFGSSYTQFKKTRHYYPQITFTTVSKNLSKDLIFVLKDLGFKFFSSAYKPKKPSESLKYKIDLNGVEDLEKWLDQIGTANPIKYSRLLVWEKYHFCPPNTSYAQRLKILRGTLNPELLYKENSIGKRMIEFRSVSPRFSSNKIVSRNELVKIVEKLRKQGKKIVTCNGSFDVLHIGHLKFLNEAKEQGNMLIIGLNSDSSIKKYKSVNRPLIPQDYRAEMLSALECVDYVTIFDETTPNALLEVTKPDVHCNGEEYGENCVEAPVVKKYGGRIHLIKKFKDFSTTNLIERIKASK